MHRFHAPYGEYGNTSEDKFEFTPDAKRVRHYLYEHFITHAIGPDLATILDDLQLDQARTWEALYQLERANFVVFTPGTEDILKVPPFSSAPTRHRVTSEDGRRWYAGCAGEACSLSALVPGVQVTVRSTCPDCWEPIIFEARDRDFLSITPESAVIHIGSHPDHFRQNWLVTCDSINFFRSPEHVAAWEGAVPERKGVHFPIQLGMKWTDFSARVRYWDYDRPSNQYVPGAMEKSLEALGADVSVWQ
jgi:Alkylmercury lyase